MNNKYFAVLPLNLVYEEKYYNLSSKAILLYSLFLNRTKLSLKNKKFKDDNGVFIYYSTEQISNHLHCSLNSAKKVLTELEKAGLIRKEYQKNGLPQKIYVNDICTENKGTYFDSQKPQDKFSQKSYSNSIYNQKARTDRSAEGKQQVSDGEEKTLTQMQINRRTFGSAKNKRLSVNSNSNSASQEKQVSIDVELEEELAKAGLFRFAEKNKNAEPDVQVRRCD